MSKGQTLVVRRLMKAPAERIYRAFLDPAAMCKWNPPHGFTGTVHHQELRVGGTYRMSFTNLGTGSEHGFGGAYLELTEFSRIRMNDQFDDPSLPGTMELTIDLEETMAGTLVTVTQTGIPVEIPVEFAQAGWQQSLDLMVLLVEPEIPDAPAPPEEE